MPALSLAQLAARLGMTEASARRTLTALEEDGLVERTGDGRWMLPPEVEAEFGEAVRGLAILTDDDGPIRARRWRQEL